MKNKQGHLEEIENKGFSDIMKSALKTVPTTRHNTLSLK